jgi:hypothetical protein
MYCRTPVVIFLSDGEDDVRDEPIFDICRGAVRQGSVMDFRCLPIISDSVNGRRPLSFHAVSFGQDATSSSLRRMAQIALDVQNNAPQDPLLPAAANIPSSYTEALDTVRGQFLLFHHEGLTQTFIRCAWRRPSWGLQNH